MHELYPKGKKILLVGTFPPPLGGVSVYLKRLYNLLSKKGFDVFVWDLSKGRYLFYLNFVKIFFFLRANKNSVVHLNALHSKIILALLLLKKITSFSLIITSHNSHLLSIISKRHFNLIRKLLNKTDLVIGVSEEAISMFKNNGINIKSKAIVKNAFLSPILEEENEIIKTYNKETLDFVENRYPVIIANAFKIVLINNIDLYGLDLCVELTHRLKKKHNNIGFVFALANATGNIEYFNKIKNRIEELDLNDHFHFVLEQKEIWPLFKRVDLLIRPTYSDGYGISINEALYFGCNAIASDVCKRAEGTMLFRNRDLDDLYNKTEEILANNEK